jgi:hypothetical protein
VKYYNNCRPNSSKAEEASTISLFNKMRAPFILKKCLSVHEGNYIGILN